MNEPIAWIDGMIATVIFVIAFGLVGITHRSKSESTK